MPAIKSPCTQCREKHVKCDEQKPKCKRCQAKDLPCTRPSKKTVFRHQSSGGFAKDQKWVNSQPRQFQFDSFSSASPPPGEETQETPISFPSSPHGVTSAPKTDGSVSAQTPGSGEEAINDGLWKPQKLSTDGGPAVNTLRPGPQPSLWKQTVVQTETQATSNLWPTLDVNDRSSHWYGPSRVPATSHPGGQHTPGFRQFPLEDVQEACLMAYFVEEISHWFDLCDEDRHFQMVVPVRAREQPHLLNAIFAVAARHLSRLPQYKTPQGIVYRGQLLPDLSPHTAVEYMLRCIPALRQFHDTEDDEYRDSIIATAVILRQLEEIDDDDDEQTGVDGPIQTQANFLPIIDAVLRSPLSQSGFAKRSLIQAAYWMALRQEIYHSFMRAQPPQMILTADYWQGASRANKAVMHTVQVAKWRFGGTPAEEWGRLVKQHEHLEVDVLAGFQPMFYREPDKSKGEIFPTVWYGSNIEVTSIQQAIIAKAILTAEDPYLKHSSGAESRTKWRAVETQVRSLILELCGIALCHPSSPPALLKAMFGIQLYGDFFTDQWERNALRGVVERYRDARAWPSRRLMQMFQ